MALEVGGRAKGGIQGPISSSWTPRKEVGAAPCETGLHWAPGAGRGRVSRVRGAPGGPRVWEAGFALRPPALWAPGQALAPELLAACPGCRSVGPAVSVWGCLSRAACL